MESGKRGEEKGKNSLYSSGLPREAVLRANEPPLPAAHPHHLVVVAAHLPKPSQTAKRPLGAKAAESERAGHAAAERARKRASV